MHKLTTIHSNSTKVNTLLFLNDISTNFTSYNANKIQFLSIYVVVLMNVTYTRSFTHMQFLDPSCLFKQFLKFSIKNSVEKG